MVDSVSNNKNNETQIIAQNTSSQEIVNNAETIQKKDELASEVGKLRSTISRPPMPRPKPEEEFPPKQKPGESFIEYLQRLFEAIMKHYLEHEDEHEHGPPIRPYILHAGEGEQ